MSHRETKTVVNLYLLKENILDIDKIIKGNPESASLAGIKDGVVKIFYKNMPEVEPKWVKKIKAFCPEIRLHLTSSSCSALLLVYPPKINRYFAVCFGYGRGLLDPVLLEEGFGLKVALNVIDNEQVKSIDVKNLDTVIKNIRMDNSKETDFDSFGANIERDILNGVVGVRKNIDAFKYSEKLCGKDALKFSALVDFAGLPQLCEEIYKIYKKDEYKEHFRWIDQVRMIRNNKQLIKQLDDKMIEALHKEEWEKLWMVPPEVIDWYDKEGFSYTPAGEIFEDIGFPSFVTAKEIAVNDATLELLHSSKVYYHSLSQSLSYLDWPAYKCVYCELDVKEGRHILVAGSWYAIDKEYSKNIDEQIQCLNNYEGECDFIRYGRVNEKDYNNDLYKANKSKAVLFDRDTITYGGGHSSIEFCDLYYGGNEFIHVKRYSGSSALSHLFFQGLTPAYLLKTEPLFLKKVNDKLAKKGAKQIADDFKAFSCEIVYAIAVASEKKDIRDMLPFFSKVALAHTAKQLREAYGYKVSIKKILLDRDAIKKEQDIINDQKKMKRKQEHIKGNGHAKTKT